MLIPNHSQTSSVQTSKQLSSIQRQRQSEKLTVTGDAFEQAIQIDQLLLNMNLCMSYFYSHNHYYPLSAHSINCVQTLQMYKDISPLLKYAIL